MMRSIYRRHTDKIKGKSRGKRLSALRKNWLRSRFKEQKGVCAICGLKMLDPAKHKKVKNPCTVDHIKPLSRGGDDHYENTQAVHYKCNQEKGNKYET